MANTVFIKSVIRPSIQKREEYIDVNGKRIPKTKAKGAFSAATQICFAYSISKSCLNTGFWELIDNPWKANKEGEGKNLPSEWQSKDIWKKDKISKQTYFELKHNKPEGFYTSIAADMLNPDPINSTFVQSFSYIFIDGTTVLNLDIPRDEIAYQMCLMSSKIANSKEDVNIIEHSHYISQVNEDEEEKSKRIELIEEATSNLYTLKTKTPALMIHKFAVILEIIKHDSTVEKDKNTLSEFISESVKNRMDNIRKFNDLYDLVFTTKNTSKFEAMYLLQELVNNKIVSDYQGKYTWHNAPSTELKTLAKSKSEFIEFLLDPDSKKVREDLCAELKAKTSLNLK